MVLRRGFWVVLGLLACSLAATYLTTQSVVYERITAVLVLLLLVSWIWTGLSIRQVAVTRAARVLRMQLGQLFEERFEVKNESRWVRVWFELEDGSALPGNNGSRVLSMLRPRNSRSYVARTLLLRRGAFELGPTIVSSGDPFGLFVYRTSFPPTRKLEVLPYFVDLNQFYPPVGFLSGGQSLRKRTVEVTPYAAGIRDYAPGDSLNRIHWRSTARRDQLMVKEFEQDPQADVWIFLDGLFSLQWGMVESEDNEDPFWLWKSPRQKVTIPPHTFEYAVSSAASVAAYYIREGRSVGFVCAGQSLVVLPASRGERQLEKILETLAFIDGKGLLPLEAVVQSQVSQITRGSTTILITTSMVDNLPVVVDGLQRREARPVVVMIDAESFGGPNTLDAAINPLLLRGLPVKLVRFQENLKDALEGTTR